MIRVEDLVTTDIEAYLHQHEHKSLLRFITCGSVDDGKSTLIGRLLFESKMLFEDQLAAVEADSKKWGTNGAEIDFALLVDGLAAEREQGITIDVAYRFFTTEKRKFIVADTPGHEQYTRNMVTGASTADVAILLVDARRGILTQTRRHSFLVRSLGIRKVVVAINKMDLVGFSKEVYDQIEADFRKFAERIDLKDITTIPMSAREGDNITHRSERTPWYTGMPLVEFLETCEIDDERVQRTPFRLPVQWVNRPNLDFRGFCGLVVGGRVQPGEEIVVLPSGRKTKVAKIVAYSGDRDDAVAGESVTLTLTDEVDVSRGDMICHASAPAEVADQFEVTIVWMAEAPMLPGRPYLMKIGANTVPATVTDLKHQIDVNTLDHLAAKQLDLNGIGVCNIALDRSIPFDPYEANRDTGGFILIDRITNATVGAGMIHFALRRAHNLRPSPTAVDKDARAKLDGHKAGVVWFTGLPSAGKSTIANAVDVRLHALGVRTALLDGDNLRRGLNRDLGFTEGDRVENVRRVAEVAKLMVDAGLVVLVAVIAPFRSERQLARELVAEGEFVEVHVDTPLAVAEQRDARGLYSKARRGELPNFTGVNSPYEPPEQPELHLDLSTFDADAAAERVVQLLRDRGVVG